MRSCSPETQVFPCRRTITEECEISLTQRGINLAFGPSLSVSRVSYDDHLVVVSVFSPGTIHVNTARRVSSCFLPGMEQRRKTTFRSSFANSFFKSVQKYSVNCCPFFPGSSILVICPTAIILVWITEVAMHMIVLPCGMVFVSKFIKLDQSL